ncbi:MAG TPA: hypothetical protein VNA12_05665 [Mycobacteriales bacterium]|nr:hypothetical protein [Mycobacteriales bacterium]
MTPVSHWTLSPGAAMYEIETALGTVFAASEALAAAMAELVEHEQRRTEADLLEAVRMPLLAEFGSTRSVLVA